MDKIKCHYFNTTERCRYGLRCKYKHEQEDITNARECNYESRSTKERYTSHKVGKGIRGKIIPADMMKNQQWGSIEERNPKEEGIKDQWKLEKVYVRHEERRNDSYKEELKEKSDDTKMWTYDRDHEYDDTNNCKTNKR
jgi:hypothetical protein